MSQSAAATWSRRLAAAAGVTYVFTGLLVYFAPELAAENFPWAVSEFVAMTIGAWTLGIGFMALEAVRAERRGSRAYASLIAVWLFSALELLVVVAFLPALRTDHYLTYPYLLALALGAGSALLGAPALWRSRHDVMDRAGFMPRWIRVTYVVFVAITALLSVAALLVVPTGGTIFPEPLGAFTTRAFAAFFAALGAGGLALVVTRDPEPAVQYARAGLYPVLLIAAAAFSFLHLFDFSTRPGGLIYIGAYVATGIAAFAIVAWDLRRQDTQIRYG